MIDRLPISPEQIGTLFLLYTSHNTSHPEGLDYNDPNTIETSHYRSDLPTVIVVHGVGDSSSSLYVQLFIDALLRKVSITRRAYGTRRLKCQVSYDHWYIKICIKIGNINVWQRTVVYLNSIPRSQEPGNYIAVNWEKGAGMKTILDYRAAAANGQVVGSQLAKFVQQLWYEKFRCKGCHVNYVERNRTLWSGDQRSSVT